MIKFKAGDVVKCTDDSETWGMLTVDKTYKVSVCNGIYIGLNGVKDGEAGWFYDRFELVDTGASATTSTIREITTYVTEDGKEWKTREEAQQHVDLLKLTKSFAKALDIHLNKYWGEGLEGIEKAVTEILEKYNISEK